MVLKSWEKKGTGIWLAFESVKKSFPVLSEIEASDIWKINDRYKRANNRRNALCKFFDTLLTK